MSGLYSMPYGAGAALGGGDHGAAVARSEVIHDVGLRDLGHVEHLVDHGLRRGHPHHVLAGLADLRLERLLPGRRGLGVRRARDVKAPAPGMQSLVVCSSNCLHLKKPVRQYTSVALRPARQRIYGAVPLGDPVERRIGPQEERSAGHRHRRQVPAIQSVRRQPPRFLPGAMTVVTPCSAGKYRRPSAKIGRRRIGAAQPALPDHVAGARVDARLRCRRRSRCRARRRR